MIERKGIFSCAFLFFCKRKNESRIRLPKFMFRGIISVNSNKVFTMAEIKYLWAYSNDLKKNYQLFMKLCHTVLSCISVKGLLF